MDFISLAQSTSFKAVRRYLEEDDDFSHLDTTHASHTSDSILDMTKEAAALSTTDDNLENAPMLSPSAEAELYLLATNFLLCKYKLYIFAPPVSCRWWVDAVRLWFVYCVATDNL